MIAHLVTFTFAPETTPAQVEKAWSEIQALQGVVPSLRGLTGGLDLGYDAANAQLAIVAFFDDHEGWVSYQQHPAHQACAKEHIRPFLVSRGATQFVWPHALPA